MKHNFIKNAIIYKTTLLDADTMRERLANAPMGELTALSSDCGGFIANPMTRELITEFNSGFSFCYRYDKKVIPSSTLQQEIQRIATQLKEEEEGIEIITRRRAKEIKDLAKDNLLPKAIASTTVVTCFYSVKENLLILNTSNKNLAGRVVSAILRQLPSLKTTTIHVNTAVQGLEVRLSQYLEEDYDAFGGLNVEGSASLLRDVERFTFKNVNIYSEGSKIISLIDRGFRVQTLELSNPTEHSTPTSFVLTKDCRLTNLKFLLLKGNTEQDPSALWHQYAVFQFLEVIDIAKKIIQMFDLKIDEKEVK